MNRKKNGNAALILARRIAAALTQSTAPNQALRAANGVTYAYRRFGSAERGAPPVLFLQHFRVGATAAAFSATVPVSQVSKTATYTRAYADQNGFLTLLSDGERVTGAYALGPEAGEWLQQATLAIRACVPLDVLRDTIQPFPTFSEIYVGGLHALRGEIAAARQASSVEVASP